MITRNQRILFFSRLSAVLLLLVFVLLNAAAGRVSKRVDLTEEGLYTLSGASKTLLRSLQDPATIKVFWYNVPEQWETDRRYLSALLEEMHSVAGSQLTVRWVDMDSEDGKKEAEDAKVQPMSFQVREAGQLKLAKGYDSLEIEMGSHQDVVDQVAGQDGRLEYEIVSRLQKMNQTKPTVVGLVAPRPPVSPFAGAQQGRFNALEYMLRQQFGDGFRSAVMLDEPVPSDVDVLLVVAPKDLTDKQTYHLEQYLLGGGHVLLLLDPVHASLASGQAPPTQPEPSGLDDWLAHLGITVESGVVGDFAADLKRPRAVQTGLGRMFEFIDYPYWVMVLGQDMDATNPAIRGFDQVPLFWPAALSVDQAKEKAAGREVSILATTSRGGYRRKDLIGLDHAEDDFKTVTRADLAGKIPLMVLLKGPMTSYWKGRPAPGEKTKEEEPKKEEGASPTAAPEKPETPGETPAPAGEGTPAGAEKPAGEEEPAGAEKPAEPPKPSGEEKPAGGEKPSSPEKPAGEGKPSGDPPPGAGDPPDDPPPAKEEEKPSGPKRLEDGNGLLLVVTDADFVSDDAYRLSRMVGSQYAAGFEFVQNLAEWMGGGKGLLSLRARARKGRVLEKVEPKTQRLLKWANATVIPLLALLAWIVVFIVRKVQQ